MNIPHIPATPKVKKALDEVMDVFQNNDLSPQELDILLAIIIKSKQLAEADMKGEQVGN